MRVLDRYILGDLVRIAALTTGVLVTVIAFGATIQPLSTDALLTIGQTAKYIALVTVPMLQFALPFAAGFAGTLTLHRMANDNEVTAAAVSGLSYCRILLPVFGLGLALAMVMVLLTQWIIPRSWTVLERTIALDVTRIFQASIERGQPFEFGDLQIYADRMTEERDPAPGVDTRLVLLHVAAADLSKNDRVDRDVTAYRAIVDVYRRPEATYLKISMEDTVAYDPDDGVLAWAERIESRTIAIDNVLADDARSLTQGELLELRRNPDSYDAVRQRRERVVDALHDIGLWETIDAALAADGQIELVEQGTHDRRYVVRADSLRRGRFIQSDRQPVEIIQYRSGAPERRLRAAVAKLRRQSGADADEFTYDLLLTNCEVTNLDAPAAPNRRHEVSLESLTFAGFRAAALSSLSSPELIAVAESQPRSTERLRACVDDLVERIGRVHLDVKARLHQRYALSCTVILLMALGATLAVWRRNSPPLVVYIWAFLPSIINLVAISSGEELTRDGHAIVGPLVIWSGNVTLLMLSLVAYRQLSRN